MSAPVARDPSEVSPACEAQGHDYQRAAKQYAYLGSNFRLCERCGAIGWEMPS